MRELMRMRRSAGKTFGDVRNPLPQRLGVGEFFFVDAGTVAFRRGRSAKRSSTADHDHLIAQHGGKDREHRNFFASGDLSPRGKGGSDFVPHFKLGEDAELELPIVEKRFDLSRHIGPIDRGADDHGVRRQQILRRHLSHTFEHDHGPRYRLGPLRYRFRHSFRIAG